MDDEDTSVLNGCPDTDVDSFDNDDNDSTDDENDLPDDPSTDNTAFSPVDNINGTSTVPGGDASGAVNNMVPNPFSNILNTLTGGATDLADGLAGDFTNPGANQPVTANYAPLLIGGAAILILFLVIK